jgi:hypothetical protein
MTACVAVVQALTDVETPSVAEPAGRPDERALAPSSSLHFHLAREIYVSRYAAQFCSKLEAFVNDLLLHNTAICWIVANWPERETATQTAQRRVRWRL